MRADKNSALIFIYRSKIDTFKMFPRNILKACFSEIFIREGGLVRPSSKSCRFSHPPLRVPKYGTGCFVACGRRQRLLALDLGSIFEKLLHQKTFKPVLILEIPILPNNP
jgi:hypothetical protein